MKHKVRDQDKISSKKKHLHLILILNPLEMKNSLILILISLFIYGCSIEGNPFDSGATYDWDLPCYEAWNLYHFEIYDQDLCAGEMKFASIRKNEKLRLEEILANSNDSCILVTFKYYFLGMKFEKDGYITNSSETFFQTTYCD